MFQAEGVNVAFVECSNGDVSVTKRPRIEVQRILSGILLSIATPVILPEATAEIALAFGGKCWFPGLAL